MNNLIKTCGFILYVFSCAHSLQAQCDTDKEKIKKFLHDIYPNKNFNLREDASWGLFSESVTFAKDKTFNEADKACMKKQMEEKNFQWDKSYFSKAEVIPVKEIDSLFDIEDGWDTFRNQYGNCLTVLSMPVFSPDGKYCIFYQWTQCDWLAGIGNVSLYELVNKKWILRKTYMSGVS